MHLGPDQLTIKMLENYTAYTGIIEFANYMKTEINEIKIAKYELIKNPEYTYFNYFSPEAFYLLHSIALNLGTGPEEREKIRANWLLNLPLLGTPNRTDLRELMAPRKPFTIDEKVSRPIQFQEQFAKRIEEIYSDPCLGLNSGPLNIDSHKLKFFTYQENLCDRNLLCLYNYLRMTFPHPKTILVCKELTDIEKIKNFV
jgi:hypothetical protein